MSIEYSELSHEENCTDSMSRHGQSLVTFDPVAERRLRTKIDLMIVPTVALLYLFCFIDRANIGKSSHGMMALSLRMRRPTLTHSRQCQTCGTRKGPQNEGV